MATDLKDDASHEEIEAFAEQAAKDIEDSRKGEEEKGDAQRIAEDNDTPVTERTAETESGSDGETAEKGEEEAGQETQADWLDEDLKAEVAAYGISEEELADFQNREELERALRFFDRSALEAGRKAMAEGEETEPKETAKDRDDQGRFAKKEATEGEYKVSLDPGLYDEEVIGEFGRLHDHFQEQYGSRLSALESQVQDYAIRMEETIFDGLVDTLGHADLFGTTDKENAKQLQRREDLLVAVKAHQIGLKALGREVDLDKALVARVARMVFADELGKKDLKARTRKVSKQSDSRMGGGSAKSPGPEETPEEWAKRRYKELEGSG